MKIVITLTTIPPRLSSTIDGGLKSCIDSLVNQTFNDYEIHFNIPNENKITKEKYVIPNWLLEYSKIRIFRTEDFGPATKLIPTVERITDSETIIVVVDDDLIYHKQMLQAQVANQLKWDEAIVGYDGLRSRNEDGAFASNFKDPRDYFFTSHSISSRVDILQHYKTISYKRRYFDNDFFDFVQNNYSWSDDMLMAAYFSFKKRDRIVETHPLIPKIETNEEWSRIGGVLTFPVINHTIHDNYEGCNIFRQTNIDDNGSILYKFIDLGYDK